VDFNNFLKELKKRKVYKVAVVYGAVSWLLLQITSVVFPYFNVPDWIMRIFIFVIILGFPLALVLAWLYQLTPEGVRQTTLSNESKHSSRKLISNKLIIGLLIIAIIGQFFYNNYRNIESIIESSDKTIAVLPFINDSANEENLFFCNGIMQGILDHLGKIPEFTVISRTSVEQYRNNKPLLKTIAEELGVNYIVEGSVQRIGNQAIIFTQLIYSEDDQNLWSHTYKEEIIDVFSVQANIAESIASKLKTIISPEVQERINSKPTENLTAYDYYLKGQDYKLEYLQDRSDSNYKNAISNYKNAIEIDSLMSEPYAELAHMYR